MSDVGLSADALIDQLQECLDRLLANADRIAGDIFHHDALFADPVMGRLDKKIEALIAELKGLSRPEVEG